MAENTKHKDQFSAQMRTADFLLMLLLMQLLSYKQDNVQNDPKMSASVCSKITALKSSDFLFLISNKKGTEK